MNDAELRNGFGARALWMWMGASAVEEEMSQIKISCF